jgi:hypothetical protein
MKANVNEIEISGVVYVKKGADYKEAVNLEGLNYVIVRSRNHGVLAGYLVKYSGQTVELIHSRRIWYYTGCETLEELAVYGTKKIGDCKITPTVENKEIMLEACGIIYCTLISQQCIEGAKEWRC